MIFHFLLWKKLFKVHMGVFSGEVTLPFSFLICFMMVLTIKGKNLLPYEQFILEVDSF